MLRSGCSTRLPNKTFSKKNFLKFGSSLLSPSIKPAVFAFKAHAKLLRSQSLLQMDLNMVRRRKKLRNAAGLINCFVDMNTEFFKIAHNL